MEKELTDEEIIEAFKGSSQNHGYFTEINGKWVKYEDVFDLIHRLQKAKEFFEKGYEVTKKIIDEKNEKICELEEENERLQDEKYKVEQNLKQCENGYELELHTARFDMRMNRERVGKLQKQVDELTAFKSEAISMSLYLKGRKDGEEVAVKDTAKECYEIFKFYRKNYYDIPLDLVARDIKEKTGVEVE